MTRKTLFLVFMFAIVCLFPSVVYAMGEMLPVEEPQSTREVSSVDRASQEALAKEQVENLREIAVNSETDWDAAQKIAKDVEKGRMYLYKYNDIAGKELLDIIADKNENWKMRYAAIATINPDYPPESFDLCVDVFNDKNEKIELRRAALNSISRSQSEANKSKAVDFFIAALRDEDDGMASMAANKLGRLKDSKAIKPLMEAVRYSGARLKQLYKTGWDEYKKGSTEQGARMRTAMRALGELKAKEAIPLLVEVLQDRDFDIDGNVDDINGGAARALGEIGDKSALPALEKARAEKYLNLSSSGIRVGIDKLKGK